MIINNSDQASTKGGKGAITGTVVTVLSKLEKLFRISMNAMAIPDYEPD
jgi:hypothetical protein